MLFFESEWQKAIGSEMLEKCGIWNKTDFYGPYCNFKMRKDKTRTVVIPISVSCESAENSIGDFNILKLMSQELFKEIGEFYLQIPKFNRSCFINSSSVEKVLLKVVTDIPLI